MPWMTDALTLDTIIDDILALGIALNLQKYIIFAHSSFGIIALELAKKYPNLVAGIIMVGTPVNSNPDVASQNDCIFQMSADENRKAIDTQRSNQVAQEDLSNLSFSQRFLR